MSSRAEQTAAADALQRPLRSRFRARLSGSVDMTSDVKDGEQLFYVRIIVFSLCPSEEPEPVKHDG
jgi:hypothetical protein